MIIYKAINNENGKCFIGIGQCCLTQERMKHRNNAINGSSLPRHSKLHNALLRFGWNSFSWEVLEKIETEKDLKNELDMWIWLNKSDDFQFGYN